jgi:hypothetical protein
MPTRQYFLNLINKLTAMRPCGGSILDRFRNIILNRIALKCIYWRRSKAGDLLRRLAAATLVDRI